MKNITLLLLLVITTWLSAETNAVEAFYQKARIAIAKNDQKQAKLDYEKCYQSSKALQNKGIKDFGRTYASEALFFLAEIELNEYLKTNLTKAANRAELEKLHKRKFEDGVRLSNKYQEVMNYTGKEYGLASLRRAEVLENNAEAVFNQKRFKNKTILDDLGKEEAICKESETAFSASLNLYNSSINEIDDFVRIFRQSTNTSVNQLDSLIKADPANMDLINRKKELLNDTVIAFTLKSKELAKAEVLKIQYTLGNVYKKAALTYAGLTPENLEYKNVGDLAYYDEMMDTHIDKMIKPKVASMIEAHQKNLLSAKEYDLINNEWAEKSRSEITNSGDVISSTYLSLAKRLIKVFIQSDNQVKELNSQKISKDADGLVIAPRKIVNGEKIDVLSIHENMKTVIDYITKTLENSAANYENNLAIGKSDMNKADFDIVARNYLKDILNISASLDSLIAYNNSRQNELSEEMKKRSELAELYEMGDKYVYEATAKDIEAVILNSYAAAYDKIKKYSISNEYSAKIASRLLTSKPAVYYQEMGYKSVYRSFGTDLSWKTIPIDQPGWTKIDFDTKDWSAPDMVTATEKIASDSILVSNKVKAIWSHYDKKYDALKSHELKKADQQTETSQIYWFRKDFELSTLPISGEAYLSIDGRYGLIVNGVTVFDMFLNGGDILEEDSIGWNKVRKYKITDYLKQGKNSIIIFAMDLKEPNNGFSGFFKIEALDK